MTARRLPQADEPADPGARSTTSSCSRTVTDTYADVMPADRGDPAQHREDRQHAGPQGAEAQRVPQGRRRRSPTPPRRSWTHNGDNLIRLGQLSEPILRAARALLPGPSRACSRASSRQAPRLADAFRGFIFHINLETLPDQPRGYTRSRQAGATAPTTRPTARDLPNPPVPVLPQGRAVPEPQRRRRRTSARATTSARRPGSAAAVRAADRRHVRHAVAEGDCINSLHRPRRSASPSTRCPTSPSLLFGPASPGRR